MDVVEFQKKLKGICDLAKENGNVLAQAQIREYFAGAELGTDQLLKVLQYLKVQGISIEGEKALEKADADAEKEEKQERVQVPLTQEEKEYLKEYLDGIAQNKGSERTEEELFSELAEGDTLALAELTQRYLPVAAQMAADMNCEEIHLADLIQEANVCLLTALESPEPAAKNDVWLRMEIRKGIISAIGEQTQQKFMDDCLVAKVEKLEAAVKELTDEDGENRFTVDELAVILDMSVEEIRDTLRLTGDDK